MLSALSGNTHAVYTGVSVRCGAGHICGFEKTLVTFRSLTDDEINAYINTGEPMDKAGSYGAQGIGALLIEKINGDFFNVMGLPLCLLAQMLKEVEVHIL